MKPWDFLSDKEKRRFNKEEYEKNEQEDYARMVEASKKIVRTIEDFKATVKFDDFLNINNKKYQLYGLKSTDLYTVDNWYNGKLELISKFKTLEEFFAFMIDGKSVKEWITEDGVGMYCRVFIG